MPYLKAIGLRANGTGWNGGGLFMSNTIFWLNSLWYQEQSEIRKPPKMEKTKEFPFMEQYGGECPGVYYRLLCPVFRAKCPFPGAGFPDFATLSYGTTGDRCGETKEASGFPPALRNGSTPAI